MYRYIVRPLLFLLSPESIHHLLTASLKVLFKIPGISVLIRSIYFVRDGSLETDFLGIKFSSPLGMAAGFDKKGDVYNEFSDFGFSHIEVGTVTPKGQPGNPKPRSFRIPQDKGLINRMGFNNPGVEAIVQNLEGKRRDGLIIGGNIGKNTLTPNEDAVSDYNSCFTALYGHVDYFVVNVSCPNITDLHELQDQDGLEAILGSLATLRRQEDIYTPILLKISPDLNNKQIDTSLEIVNKYGIDGVVATNTTVSRKNLSTSPEKIKAIANGGLSGGPITSRSLEVVKYVSEKTEGKLPIIGVGGIMTVQDAQNMLDAGATLIQVYTGFIYNGPAFMKKINKAILKRKMAK
ncbi:MAG: quinone-dependent dihydroorotate dehydrogenase [Bacteroidales bacterium]|jgi:dihydroorotate dehydrogenase|nr:quinone-dependent dihydroorotate dehydrogenase [Bacteroidales bacterium]